MEASQVDLFYQSYIRRSFQHQLNLHRWFVEDPGCALCSNASHPHRVPNQCHPRALYSTWHHTQFLKDLASTHGGQTSCHQLLTTTTINPATGKLPLSVRGTMVTRSCSTPSEQGQLCLACDWKMLADIGQEPERSHHRCIGGCRKKGLLLGPEVANQGVCGQLWPDSGNWTPLPCIVPQEVHKSAISMALFLVTASSGLVSLYLAPLGRLYSVEAKTSQHPRIQY